MMLLLCGWGSGSAFVRILSFRLILTFAGLSPHFPSFLFRRAERSKQSTLSFILVLARGNTFLQYFSIFFTVFSFYPHIFFSLIKENIFKRKLKTFNFWWDAFCLLKNVMNFNFYPSTTSICLLSVGDIVVGDMILHCWPHYPLLFPLPAIHTFVFLLFLICCIRFEFVFPGEWYSGRMEYDFLDLYCELRATWPTELRFTWNSGDEIADEQTFCWLPVVKGSMFYLIIISRMPFSFGMYLKRTKASFLLPRIRPFEISRGKLIPFIIGFSFLCFRTKCLVSITFRHNMFEG